jgi:hypothetical protein
VHQRITAAWQKRMASARTYGWLLAVGYGATIL